MAIMTTRPYPTYRPSGVEWLGDIPAHWEVKRLKHLGELQAGAGFPDDEQWDLYSGVSFLQGGRHGKGCEQTRYGRATAYGVIRHCSQVTSVPFSAFHYRVREGWSSVAAQ